MCPTPRRWRRPWRNSRRPDDHAQHPAGRVGRPEDVASLVAWLLAEAQSFVTGSEFVIDGGMTRKMIYSDEAAGV